MSLPKNFPMRTVADCISRLFENEKGLFAKSVQVKNTIGFNRNGSGNVLNVVFEQHCEVERSWSPLSCHFTNGTFAWLL